MRKYLISALTLLYGLSIIKAQNSYILPSYSSLSGNLVYCMEEDSKGHIWIGTNTGLNCFNGSVYKLFSANEGELANNTVRCLLLDGDDKIWAGTYSGINLIENGLVNSDVRIATNTIFSMALYDEDNILYSTRKQLSLVNKKDFGIKRVYEDDRITYNKFILTKDKKIWINQLIEPIITILDENFQESREINLHGSIINDISEARDSSVLVLTNKGIIRYDSSGRRSESKSDLEKFTEGKYVIFYKELSYVNAAIIGIRDQGIYMFGHNSGTNIKIWDNENLADLSAAIVLPTEHGLFLSPDNYGLTYHHRYSSKSSITVPQDSKKMESLNMFFDMGDEKILILTNKNVYRHNLSDGTTIKLQADDISGDYQLNIAAISENNRLWLVCGLTELREYEFRADRLILRSRHKIQPTTSMWTRPDGSIQVLQDEEILSFYDNGVVTRQELKLPPPDFWFCGQTASGKPIMLTTDDLYTFDFLSVELLKMDINIPSPSAFYEDGDGILWIGSKSNGLYKYDPENKSLINIDYKQGLSDASIRSIIGDRDGNIWASTSTKVAKIDAKKLHVTMFNSPTELTRAFSTNSALALDNGFVMFGSMNKIAVYYNSMSSRDEHLQLELDGILVNGHLIRQIPETLILNNNEDQVSFYFSVMNFNPDIVPNYEYRLVGYDKGWIPCGENYRAGYSGLKPGRYSFELRMMQPSGEWVEQTLLSEIRIKPHPFGSWPAIILYVLIIGVILYYSLRWYVVAGISKNKLEFAEQEKVLNEQISQERINFFSNVSHEFRTPLELIYGPIKDLSAKGKFEGKEKKLFEIIERNAERMIKLTDQLLAFNRERDLKNLAVMRTDISLLLRRMIENFNYIAQNRKLTIETELPELLMVYCDREKVEKVFFNLLSNAIKYTPESGTIRIKAWVEENNMLNISVEDTGIGISPDKIERIFNRYERLGQSVSESMPSGFGIGLNYAKQLANTHKGDLKIYPNEPNGSIFTFVFPCDKKSYENEAVWNTEKEELEEKQNEQIVSTLDKSNKKFNILIAEDNADMRAYLKSILEKQCNVTVCGDGEQAWSCIRISAPDLIISDVMMPYKDGYTLCKELKNDNEYCHIPIILLTAKADMDSHIHGLDLGADAYVSKPFESKFFLTTIKNLISNRQRMQHALEDMTSSTFEVEAEEDIKPRDKAFIERIYKIIDEHISEEDFGVSTLATELGMSRTSVFSKIKTLFGLSPQSFLNNYRLNIAMELLKAHEMNISEVAYKVGFSTLTGFSRSFKTKFGVPPSSI